MYVLVMEHMHTYLQNRTCAEDENNQKSIYPYMRLPAVSFFPAAELYSIYCNSFVFSVDVASPSDNFFPFKTDAVVTKPYKKLQYSILCNQFKFISYALEACRSTQLLTEMKMSID